MTASPISYGSPLAAAPDVRVASHNRKESDVVKRSSQDDTSDNFHEAFQERFANHEEQSTSAVQTNGGKKIAQPKISEAASDNTEQFSSKAAKVSLATGLMPGSVLLPASAPAEEGTHDPSKQAPLSLKTRSSQTRGITNDEQRSEAAHLTGDDGATAILDSTLQLVPTPQVQTGTPEGRRSETRDANNQAERQNMQVGVTNASPLVAAATQNNNPALALRVAGAQSSDDDAETDKPAAPSDESLAPRQTAVAELDGDSAESKEPRDDDPQQSRGDHAPESVLPAADNHTHPPVENPAKLESAAPGNHLLDLESELAKFHREPVRGAQVQITGTDNQRVDIHMIERAGVLSLTMRTADHALTRSLQEHASELDGRLAAERYRTELWTPASRTSSDVHDDPAREREAGNGGQSGGGQADYHGQQGNQNRKGNQQPKWLEDFENQARNLQSRIEYTWHP